MLPRVAEAEVEGVAQEAWVAPNYMEIIREAVLPVEPKDLADANTDRFWLLGLITASRLDGTTFFS